MNDVSIASAAFALVLAVLVAGCRPRGTDADPDAAPTPADTLLTSMAEPPPPASLYGRVTTHDGVTYQGPLRWGVGEEAFWDHYFNGVKDENPWAAHTPFGPSEERRPTTVFGLELPWTKPETDLSRPFMARFGDITRIEAYGDGVQGVLADGVAFDPDVRVTLKSGAAFDLDRLEASDFDDGVRVWDIQRGAVDIGPRYIRTIELFPPEQPRAAPDRLYGTVRTSGGDFAGFLQWDREEAVGHDELVGRTDDGEVRLRFDTIRSITRRPEGGSLVTTRDGHEIALTGTRKVDAGNRGVYVDDERYGRVLVSWDAFERVDFNPGGVDPAYDDFPPGSPLTGRVTTRDGRRLAGRLVYDLDESETTETLDAPARGVDYTIPFGFVAAIALPDGAPATVTLHSGEVLTLERRGDLGENNAGVLVFADGDERPAYVVWSEVERIDLDRPPVTYPPVGAPPAES